MVGIAQFSGLGMYDEGGKFEVKQEYIDAARAKAIEEGKKYYGDATNFEVFRDGILNLPDSAINFVARGAEGTGELFAGLASLVMKGGQLATTTDPDKLTQIMSEPSITKYMGAFRDKIPTPNLYESNISGMEDTEKAFGTAGYYASPIPPFLKGAQALTKGIAATKTGKKISNELENFQSLINKKGGKAKVIEVGGESTEGTFKYKGETYNKSDGVRIEYAPTKYGSKTQIPRSWMPKDAVGGQGGASVGQKTSKLDAEVEKILSENFTSQELLGMRNKELVSFLESKGVVFTVKQPHITVGRARKNLTGKTLKDVNITGPIKDEADKVSRKIRSQLLNEFDITGQNQINNFTDKMFDLTGFSKSSTDGMQITGTIARFINGGLNAVKRGDATTGDIIKQLKKVDKNALSDVLIKNNKIKNKLKKANELGITLDDLNLSHMEDVADNWKTSLDANNLFLATKKANQSIQRNLDKQLKIIFNNFREAKTISEKKEIVQGFKNIKQQLIDNDLVSVIDGKKIGADIDFEKSFEKFSSAADTAINKRLFRKDGGMMNINDITGPLGKFSSQI